jgi:hypothetical protein
VEGRAVVAAFDGGAITSDAGALLLGEADRAIRLTERLAACFTDARATGLVEHEVGTLVLQRVVALRWAMKTSTTMTNCGTILCWGCWPASLRRSERTARRWRASRR